MANLAALKFIVAQPHQSLNPVVARRQKLSAKLGEQIQMAMGHQSGIEFIPVKIRTVRDLDTGELQRVEIPKRLKPWWWAAENGKFCLTVRYGARRLEVVEGKNAIEADGIAGVISTLEVLRSAVEAGELDARIEAVSSLLKAAFAKDATPIKRPKLKLPIKPE
jgi:hypothetical protein